MNDRGQSRLGGKLEAVSAAAAVCVFGIGLLVLIGWMIDSATLKSLDPYLISMKANTAVAFMLTGISLWLSQTKRVGSRRGRYFSRLSALVVGAVGALTLVQYAFGWNLGIDQVLINEPAGAVQTIFPGRMAPNTALIFVLIGASLLLLDVRTRGGHRPAVYLIGLEGIVAFVALTGYVFSASPLYAPSAAANPMSLPAVLAGVITFTGLWLARSAPGQSLLMPAEHAGDIMARRLLVPVLVVPMLLELVMLMGQHAGLYDDNFASAMQVVLQTVFFLCLIGLTAASLNRTDSKRRQLQATLQRKDEQERAILDAVPAMIFYKDRENHFVRTNRAFAEAMGLPKEQLEGKSLLDIYPREQAKAFWQDDKEVMASGKPKWGIVEPMETCTGRRLVQTDKIPYTDEAGEVAGVIGFAVDITDRKRAEDALKAAHDDLEVRVAERTAQLNAASQALRAERQRFQDVLDMLPAYVVLLSPDYHVPFANRFFEGRFGRSEGRRCYEYLFQRTEPCENCETYKVMRTNAPHHWQWTGPDGRNYDIFDFPFADSDGSPMIMEMGIDITERTQAEAALTKLNETLEQHVAERTAELRVSNEDLSRFNRAAVGRELRMIELKKEINELCNGAGQPPRYPTDFEREQP